MVLVITGCGYCFFTSYRPPHAQQWGSKLLSLLPPVLCFNPAASSDLRLVTVRTEVTPVGPRQAPSQVSLIRRPTPFCRSEDEVLLSSFNRRCSIAASIAS
jgi:hypothetical protein